jgi:ATP-binding cassette, subfamily G (WHITE), member 2, SNQ2
LSPDLGFAGNVLVFIVCTFNWFNGIIVPYEQIQVFWRYWLYYLSPFTYFLGGTVTAVIEGVQVNCSAKDVIQFNPPPGKTCGDFAGDWAAQTSGYLLNPEATQRCDACKWTNGDQYLAEFHLGGGMWGGIWGYYGIFVAFTVLNLALVYFFTWATKIKRWKLFYFF